MLVCTDDWLEIYNIYRDGTEKIIGRYCGMTAPGPLECNRGAMGLKILLHTNSEGVSSGFKARYFFDVAKPIFGGECSDCRILERLIRFHKNIIIVFRLW